MKQKNYLSGIGAAVGILFLILDSKTAIQGAQEGIELCIRSVIPPLFPFFILSIALTSSLAGMSISMLHPLGRLCEIPPGGEAILLTGFLGGYPVGAQAVAQAHSGGQLTRSQANRMLAFCNNAGPSFLFGIIGGCFPGMGYAWLLWGIHLISAILVAVTIPGKENIPIENGNSKSLTITELMKRSLTVMANVCGWVILFRVILAILNRWIFWALPIPVQVLLSGMLELTNGCCMLTQIENVGLRFILCAVILTFGGLCVTMQTVSVTSGLSCRSYMTGKLLQTAICTTLAAFCQGFFQKQLQYPISAVTLAVLVIIVAGMIVIKRQKNSSNPMTVGV